MRYFISAITGLLFLSLLEVAFADNHAVEPSLKRRHAGLSSSRVGISRAPRGLEKRFDNARFTLYQTGLGACGNTNSNTDFIVALNTQQYGSGGHCFDMITISYGGKTSQAQIVDMCPGCPYGGLDFSPSLFDFFASESEGVIYGSWTFGSGETTTTSTTKAQSTQTPSTSYTPSTTSHSSSTSSTVSSTSSTTISSTSTTTTTTTTSTLATPSATGTDVAVPTDVIAQFYMIMVDIGGIAVAAGSA